jgi:two-component system response regulator PilR (NtrC family)
VRDALSCITLARFRYFIIHMQRAATLCPEPAFRLIGESPSMRAVREQILRIANSEAAVAIVGESGSGKELAARDLHAHSRRCDHPFIAVNCGAIPEALMESEFFGHKRGAFTGAHEERGGFFQAAHRGTLFLDEVAELPPAMQVKLLRALQERSVRKLGGQREEPVDVRVVSATNRDLADAVRCGEFRQDLYYRLQVIELRLPPLRERRQDLPLLCETILSRLAGARHPQLTDDALERLRAHAFPGNVRELENILERAVALVLDAEIHAHDLQFESPTAEVTAPASVMNPPAVEQASLPLSLPAHLASVERALVRRALQQSRFHRGRAATLLGISLRQLRYRMQRLAIHDLD